MALSKNIYDPLTKEQEKSRKIRHKFFPAKKKQEGFRRVVRELRLASEKKATE